MVCLLTTGSSSLPMRLAWLSTESLSNADSPGRPAAHAPQQHEQRKRYSTAVARHLDSSSINGNLFYQVSQTESAKELTLFRRFCGVETINTLPTLGILEKK